MTYEMINPKRVEIIIATAKIVEFPVTELAALVLDALDADRDETLFPIYNVLPDAKNFDPRAFMIFFMHNMIGSDDDHDYVSHDLDHAAKSLDPCIVHATECMTCCEPCLED